MEWKYIFQPSFVGIGFDFASRWCWVGSMKLKRSGGNLVSCDARFLFGISIFSSVFFQSKLLTPWLHFQFLLSNLYNRLPSFRFEQKLFSLISRATIIFQYIIIKYSQYREGLGQCQSNQELLPSSVQTGNFSFNNLRYKGEYDYWL